MSEKEQIEYLAAKLDVYKGALALLVDKLIRSRSIEVQVAFRDSVEKSIKETLPQAAATYIPPGARGDGFQEALDEILSELLTI